MMKILVVDGHTETRRAIVEALSQIVGLVVQCSIPDRETAARVLAHYTPDLLVVGTQLADGDGLDLVADVRRPGMSIVVVGPAESRDVWLRYLAAGADRFVEPDDNLAELRDVVRALVRHRSVPDVDAVPEAPAPVAAGSGSIRIPTRAAGSGIIHAFNNHIHSIELILEVLERSPGDKHLWTEARIALERAVCMTALLLGHVHGRHRRTGPARGVRGAEGCDPATGGD
jgi:DNA-binding response OmpR family regulator